MSWEAVPATGMIPLDVMTPDLDVNDSDAENGEVKPHHEATRSAAVADKRTPPAETTP